MCYDNIQIIGKSEVRILIIAPGGRDTVDSSIDIMKITHDAAGRFAKMLDGFNLGVSEDTGFPERNLSFQFGHAFLQYFPSGAVFQEVTFDKRKHLDTLLVSDGFAIALECKVLLNRRRVADLAADAERLEEIVVPHMKKRFKNDPPKWYTMLLCETWWTERGPWWTDAVDIKPAWTRPDLLDNYELGSIPIRDDISFVGGRKIPWSVIWLYGYREYREVEG